MTSFIGEFKRDILDAYAIQFGSLIRNLIDHLDPGYPGSPVI